MTDFRYSFSLGSIPFIEGGRSRSISAENRTGEKGKGGMAAGPLGPSRKGSPAIIGIQSGATATLVSRKGPGSIRHIWMTVSDEKDQGFFMLSDIVLRMYWDDEENPSVEVPLGDFFLNGFSTYQRVCSAPITVNPAKGFNSFFQMPFAKSARITIENQHPGPIGAFFYQIDYTEYDELPPSSYFHAQYRRERLTEPKVDYTILDGVEGRGHFVGLYMGIRITPLSAARGLRTISEEHSASWKTRGRRLRRTRHCTRHLIRASISSPHPNRISAGDSKGPALR